MKVVSDYNHTFAPVVKSTTIRALVSTATLEDMESEQLVVETAYLSAGMDTEVYVTYPPAFNLSEERQENAR